MAALAANKEIIEKGRELISFPVVASDIIYKGAICKINAAGYLAPMAAEAGAAFAGMAWEKVDNSAGSAGDENCRVQRVGIFEMVTSGAAQSAVGSIVYASDDQTVSTTQGTNELAVGRIIEVISATKILVDINVY